MIKGESTLRGFKRVPILIPFLLLFLVVTMHLSAGGRRENPFDAVNKLMEEKQYNEALTKLVEIGKQHPEMMEEVEKRIGEVRQILNSYNSKYAELIDVLFNKHDVGEALKIIKELEELNPNPNESTLESLTKAKRGAEVVYNLNRFEEIMDKGLKELKEGLYYDALKTYIQGFTLHKEEFDNSAYGDIVKNSVNTALSKLKNSLDALIKTGPSVEKQFGNVALLVSGPESDKFYSEGVKFIAELKKIADIRNTIYSSSVVFNNQNSRIKKISAKHQDDYFLYYAYALTRGRKSTTEREGILAAVEIYWENMILSLGEKIKESADLFFAKGVDQFNSKMYTAADSELDRAYAFYSIYSKVTALWETRVVLLKNLAIESKSTDLVKEKLPQYLYAVERLKEIDTYREIGNLMNSLPTTAMADTASKDVITASREKIRGIERSISEHKLKWTNYKQYYESVASLKFRVNTQVTEASAMVQRLDNLFTLVRREDIRFVNAYNFIEYNELKKTLEDYKRMYGEAAGLNEGYDVVIATVKDEKGREVKITRKEKHPTEALQKLNDLKFSVEEFMRRSDSFLNAVKSDEVLKSDKEEYTIWVKNGRAVVRGAEGLTGKINSAIQDADNLIILAKRYKNEGMLRLNQAQAYLKTERFDDSKDSIKLASRAFETSLKYEENKLVRDMLDKTLPDLSREVVKSENLFVVREVRRLINKGRSYYGVGNFVKAEETFLKAKARWEDTNPTENKEVTNWLTIVRSALSVKSGREISEKNPLYAEITQLLNLATENFLKGQSLLKKGKKVEALRELKSARDKLERIRLSFPYNREARVLTLKIQQLSDPENFAASLTKFYNEAVKNMRKNPQEAYADLKDIEEIKPNYPGLKKAIYNLEIALKIRIPPPDPKKIAESSRLYSQAYQIVIKNQIDLFPAALAQLNKAIELNPDNQKAMSLKDRIQIAAGGTIQTVLSSSALEQYKIAENKYLAGNYFEALAIVERLLKDKRNQGYPPLLELKRRLEAKI